MRSPQLDDCVTNAECPEACVGGTCVDLATGGGACDDDDDFVIGLECTAGVCTGPGGPGAPCGAVPHGDPCDDGDDCTHTDTCENGVCAGTAYSCSDGEPCTDDVCLGDGSCDFLNNSDPCDDGLFCTGTDTCNGGACSHTGDPCAGIPCDDNTDACEAPQPWFGLGNSEYCTWDTLADWGAGGLVPGAVSATPNRSIFPSLVLDTGGYPTVAWLEHDVAEVYLRQFDGDAWIERGNSASGGGVSASGIAGGNAALALDSSGQPIVAWREGSVRIYAKRWNGAEWVEMGGSASGNGIHACAVACQSVDLALGPADQPVVVWQEPDDTNEQIVVRCSLLP